MIYRQIDDPILPVRENYANEMDIRSTGQTAISTK